MAMLGPKRGFATRRHAEQQMLRFTASTDDLRSQSGRRLDRASAAFASGC
jgi:hypothetical protein